MNYFVFFIPLLFLPFFSPWSWYGQALLGPLLFIYHLFCFPFLLSSSSLTILPLFFFFKWACPKISKESTKRQYAIIVYREKLKKILFRCYRPCIEQPLGKVTDAHYWWAEVATIKLFCFNLALLQVLRWYIGILNQGYY